MFAAVSTEEALFNLAMLALVAFLAQRFMRRRPTNSTAHGSAFLMPDNLLKKWGMLQRGGLFLGRTLSGKLLYLHDFVHLMIIGGTGSGKSAGVISTNLIQSSLASITTDPKRELAMICSGTTIASDNSGHGLNPLDTIKDGDVDACRQMAYGMIDTQEKSDSAHWNETGVKVVTATLCYVTKACPPEERNLKTVMSIISSNSKLVNMAQALDPWGGTYANMAGQIAQLFSNGSLTKEGSSVMSTATRHLAWLDGIAGETVTRTTFDLRRIRAAGNRIYLHVPVHFSDAHRGWMRVMTTALLEAAYKTNGGEILIFYDEAWQVARLPSVEKVLLLGRSSGMHLGLAYQSLSQVKDAFPGKETLIPDNCNTHIHLQVGNVEDAEKLSKAMGKFTMEVWNESVNSGMSSGTSEPGTTHNRGGSQQASLIGRELMTEAELLSMPSDQQVIVHRGLPGPILARKAFWFNEPAFGGKKQKTGRSPWKRLPLLWRVVLAIAIWVSVMVAMRVIKDAQ